MFIFLDSSFFCAYKNRDDVHHENSVKVMESIANQHHGRPVTTDYIFDETLTVLMRKANKSVAVDVGDLILNSEIVFVEIDKIVFEAAWKIFQKTKNLSFTDCTNIAFMKIFGLEKIATFDKGFSGIEGIRVIDR